jgi:acyl-coenzyme A synthetase/AMP-(fatty) acid ligase
MDRELEFSLMRITDDGEVTFTSRRGEENDSDSRHVSHDVWESLDHQSEERFLFCSEFDRYFSRGEAKDLAARIASIILRLGIKTNDVVHCSCRNSALFVATHLAIVFSGAVYAALVPESTALEWSREVKRLDSKLLVCDQDNLPTALQVTHDCEVRNIIVLQSPAGLAESSLTDDAVTIVSVNIKYLNFEVVMQEEPITAVTEIPLESASTRFFIPFSSGSTGAPKAIQLSHAGWLTQMNVAVKAVYSNNKADIELVMMELVYMVGLVQLYGCLLSVRPMVLCDFYDRSSTSLDVQSMLMTLIDHRISQTWWTPTEFIRVNAFPGVREILAQSSLKQVTYCGAILPVSVAEKFAQLTDNRIDVIPLYGSTEAGIITIGPKLSEENNWSGGALAAGVQVTIRDRVIGGWCLPTQKGEIWTRSSQNMIGYLDRERESFESSGWFRTGDIGFMDEQGLLHVCGRCKDVIRVYCTQVDPAELEDLLLQHEDVAQAAVIAVKDQELLEVPKAFVVLKKDSEKVREMLKHQILEFVDSKVSVMRRLAGGIVILSHMPLISFGKVDKMTLRKMHEEGTHWNDYGCNEIEPSLF